MASWYDSLMPGESMGMPNGMGGQKPMGLLDNPALQMGLGILANNQGNYGSFGAALGKGGLMGMQNIQRQQEAMRQQKIMEMHAKQIEAQQAEQQRRVQQESESKASTLRLLSGDPSAYQSMQEQPFTRTENVPQAPMPDAQAPNFNTTPQTVTGVNRVPQFDNNKYMQDVINAGYGSKILENRLIPKSKKLAFAPNGVAYDENNPELNIGDNYGKPEDNKPVNGYLVSDGNGGWKIDPVLYRAEQSMKRSGASNTSTVINNNTDKKYGEILGGKLAEQDAATIDAARSSPDRLTNARNIKTILKTNPITGTGAEWRLSANKALATAGLIDGTQVKNTEDLASNLAASTLDAIKTSGLGAGQGFTDKDRQFLERARSGNIEINAGTLKTLADLNERAALKAIDRGNSVVRSIKSDPNSGTIGSRLEEIQVPDYVEPTQKTISLKDIADAAKASGKTTAQVTKDAKAAGYKIGN